METLDLAIRNLFAEFQEAVFARAELEKSLGEEETFVRKTVKGKTYWYRQRYVDGQARQTYVGPADGRSDARAEGHRKNRRDQKNLLKKMRADEERRAAALRRAGLPNPDAASASVLDNLSSLRLIDRHGLLVGSFAFMAYAGLLGRLFEKSSVRTLDIDVVGDASLWPAGGSNLRPQDVLPDGFRAIPPLSLKQLSSRFAAPSGLRIDFLVPQRGKPRVSYRAVGLEDVGAEALPFLDFLIKEPVRTVLLVPWGGVSVTVPDPCRFAVHKLIVSQRRPVTEDAKVRKDLMQAEQLIVCCAEERPSDLRRIFKEGREAGKKWKLYLERGIASLTPQTAKLLPFRP
jgi:hypothetical protein